METVLRGVVGLADVVTYPIHYLLNWPSSKTAKYTAIRAAQLNPDDPYSPWVRLGKPPATFVDGVSTIDGLIRKIVRHYRDRPCLGYRRVLELTDGGKRKRMANELDWLTFGQFDARIDTYAAGLASLGVQKGDKVVIFMETRYEWMIVAQAVFRLGATLATLYATLGDEGVVHGIQELETKVVITSVSLIAKLKIILNKCPLVTGVVVTRDEIGGVLGNIPVHLESNVTMVALDDLEERGRLSDFKPSTTSLNTKDDLACIMFTSGSTGAPKGVLLNHDNVIVCIRTMLTMMHDVNLSPDTSYIAYLPQAHILEFGAELIVLSLGCPVGYATATTLTDGSTGLEPGCMGDISLIEPEVMVSVPLILDRIRKAVEAKIKGATGETGLKLFNFVIQYKNSWNAAGFRTPLIDFLVVRRFRAMLGGRIKLMLCGGAPLSADTQAFARAAFDVTLAQGWASTECTGIGTVMDAFDVTIGRCGAPLFGARLKLRDWDEAGYRATDKPRPRGELIIGGPAITQGYFKRDQETKEAFFEEDGCRWQISGDIGEVYPDGTIKIVDRRKDLVKLQHGEYISLGKVEAELKGSPLVDNVCVIGDGRYTFVVALVVPNVKALEELAKVSKIEVEDNNNLFDSSELTKKVLKAICDYGQKSRLLRLELPRACKLCKEEWTPSNGLTTAALKIRRKPIQDFYAKDIEQMYSYAQAR